MRKRLIFKIFAIFFLFSQLLSCRTESEIIIDSNNLVQNQEYSSKSLWKEDEKYIKNVKAIFEKNADKNYFNNNFGHVYWDYAITLGSFDETFLDVPVIKNGKVSFVLVAEREGNKVYFKRNEDRNALQFFDFLVFKEPNQLKGRIVNNLPSNNKGSLNKSNFCVTYEITWTWTNEETGAVEMETTYTMTKCSQIGGFLPCQSLDPDGGGCAGSSSGNSGGSGGGYSYGNLPLTFSPCEKIQNIGKNAKTKYLMNELKGKTNQTSESGYILTAESGGIVNESPVVGLSGKAGIDFSLPAGTKIDGFIHSHYTGLLSVFSPDDIFSLALLFKTNAIKNIGTFVLGVTTASNTQYMIVIDDPTKFANFANGLFSGNVFDDVALEIYKDNYANFNIKQTNDASTNEENFVIYLNLSKSGLKVLKGSPDMENWQQLGLDEDSNVIPINCN